MQIKEFSEFTQKKLFFFFFLPDLGWSLKVGNERIGYPHVSRVFGMELLEQLETGGWRGRTGKLRLFSRKYIWGGRELWRGVCQETVVLAISQITVVDNKSVDWRAQ